MTDSDPAPSAAALQPRADNLRGLVLMLAAFSVFAGVDIIAKVLAQTIHPVQIVWFRQLGLLAALLVFLALQGRAVLRTNHIRMQLFRGALAACSAICFIFGLRHVPLADAIAVTFVAPLIVTALGAAVLREPVGLPRWLAVGVGFVGMLIVVRPGTGVFQPAMLFVVTAAFFFALRQIVSRALSASDRTVTTVAYTALGAMAVATLPLPAVWQTPGDARVLMMLAALAILAGSGEILLIRALETGQAAVLAPAQYSLLIWGTFYGWMVFGHLPDGWTWAGSAVIIASGLFVLHRERLAARKRAPRVAAR